VDDILRERLIRFLRPLHQDLDGVTRFDDVERVAAIARQLHPGGDDAFELLLLFQLLGGWLERIGNISRTALVTGVDENDLRRAAQSVRNLDAPQSDAERAVAAARLIDGAGLRGLAERFAHARREGHSISDIARDALGAPTIPEWMDPRARALLAARREQRDAFCRALLAEIEQGNA
jgi:hypothetical protein